MSNYACNENSFFYVIKEDNYSVLILVLQCSYFLKSLFLVVEILWVTMNKTGGLLC